MVVAQWLVRYVMGQAAVTATSIRNSFARWHQYLKSLCRCQLRQLKAAERGLALVVNPSPTVEHGLTLVVNPNSRRECPCCKMLSGGLLPKR